MKKTYIKPSATAVALQIEDAILTGSTITINKNETTNVVYSESKGWSYDDWSEE